MEQMIQKRPYVHKKPIDRFTRIDGRGLSPEIPPTQLAKILELKEKHAPLFYNESQRFAIRLKKFEPK